MEEKREYFLTAADHKILLKKAILKADEVWENAKNVPSNDEIYIKHHDGSEFRVKHAHYRWGWSNTAWFITFPEHTSVGVYALDDLEQISVKNELHWAPLHKDTVWSEDGTLLAVEFANWLQNNQFGWWDEDSWAKEDGDKRRSAEELLTIYKYLKVRAERRGEYLSY